MSRAGPWVLMFAKVVWVGAIQTGFSPRSFGSVGCRGRTSLSATDKRRSAHISEKAWRARFGEEMDSSITARRAHGHSEYEAEHKLTHVFPRQPQPRSPGPDSVPMGLLKRCDSPTRSALLHCVDGWCLHPIHRTPLTAVFGSICRLKAASPARQLFS
jgi:hypothetical protein